MGDNVTFDKKKKYILLCYYIIPNTSLLTLLKWSLKIVSKFCIYLTYKIIN